MRLIEPQTLDVVCDGDLRVRMDDGVVLLADRWVARSERDRPQPTVLIRSPYGRKSIVGLLFGRLLAERGLQVLIQSVRGTFGSEGEFAPFDERPDGLATLRWLRAQPWHSDRIGMFGPSYLGLVQWAVAADAGDDLAALAIQVSASQFYDQTYAGGGLTLENTGSWLVLVMAQENRFAPLSINRALRGLRTLLDELPLSELDERATGTAVPWFREAFANTGSRHARTGRRATSLEASPMCTLESSSSAAGTTSCCPGCSRTMPRCERRGRLRSCGSGPGLTPRRALPPPAIATGSPGCGHSCSTTAACCATARSRCS